MAAEQGSPESCLKACKGEARRRGFRLSDIDAMSECNLAVALGMQKYRPDCGGTIETFCCVIAARLLCQLLRDRKKDPEQLLDLDAPFDPPAFSAHVVIDEELGGPNAPQDELGTRVWLRGQRAIEAALEMGQRARWAEPALREAEVRIRTRLEKEGLEP